MGRSLSELDPDVSVSAKAVIDDAKAAGIGTVVPTSTGRTTLYQVALFAQGRVKDAGPADVGGGRRLLNAIRSLAELSAISDVDFAKGNAVTNADGVKITSLHQDKRAVDFVILDAKGYPVWDVTKRLNGYRKLGEIIEAHGFRWGGRFQPLNAVTGLGWDPFHADMPAVADVVG